MIISTKYILLLSQIHMLMYAATGNDNCTTKDNCNDCYQTFGCIWCDQETKLGKCYKEVDERCPVNSVVKPHLKYHVIDDTDFSNTVFLKPQKAVLSLGEGQSKTIRIKHKVPQDFKLDLYYLMDMSSSMIDDKAKLTILGESLVKEMNDLTSDFKIGFGTFIDKVTLPFFDTARKPCRHCTTGYSYKNHLNLTDNAEDFVTQVNNTQVAENVDSPEGGFDALMQAIVCKDIIGWRGDAMHLLVYVSDDLFHYAGNGLLAGIYEPNDMKCHLQNNEYPEDVSLTKDYPSVGQINLVAQREDISIIFAVTKVVYSVYRSAASLIRGSSAKKLTSDSSNIIDVIKNEYEHLTTSVELILQHSEDVLQYIDVEIVGNCKKNINKPSVCEDNKPNSIVEFDVTIKLKKCPKDVENFPDKISFKVSDLNQQVTINIDSLCTCPCEDNIKVNDFLCNGQGNSTCSICRCNEGFWGSTCSCNEENEENDCKKTDSASPCSGRGECICGECKCNSDRYSGDLCECDKFNCPRVNGKICNGQGDCNCESCDCYGGWTSSDCSCQIGTDKCLNPETNETCSNNGDCICNKCQCKIDDKGKKYEGAYCEICDDCTGRCNDYIDCVLCLQENPDDCNSKCNTIETYLVDSTTDLDGKNCTTTSNKCTVRFSYVAIKNKLYVVKKPICEIVAVWVIIVSCVGSVVVAALIGLITWKLYITWKDKKDLEDFFLQLKEGGRTTHENALYQDPNTKTTNPIYSGME